MMISIVVLHWSARGDPAYSDETPCEDRHAAAGSVIMTATYFTVTP
jgi:hypothetical protein